MQDSLITHNKRAVSLAVIVAALGYFVDIYDLLLFSIVRISSLKAIGIAETDLLGTGSMLLSMQMGGMLIGGILWGMLGDKRGRLSVLFGSIILYSLANIANGFVQSIEMYSLLRVLAGIGLAGELGAGVTLVSEVLSAEARGWGTTIIGAVGLLGAVLAAIIGDIFTWRTCFFIGGGMGIALLALRIGVYESGMFEHIKKKNISRGNFFKIFSTRKNTLKYLRVIGIGMPTWFVVGILITFSPEFGKAFGMKEIPAAGNAVLYSYLGVTVGDILSGWITHNFRSRKKAMVTFLSMTVAFILVYFIVAPVSLGWFYFICWLLGFGTGYWAMFVTIASEQFGTNIRATVTTTAPNFVRGAVVPITALFNWLRGPLGISGSALAVGGLTLLIAFISLWEMDETYGKDLHYVEELH
ncbi:MAG TPA: MFS transporter [Candidatus Kapabacteria bacterium]|nr:MFS transporter [Candidatus Kapabacteria bacterium]